MNTNSIVGGFIRPVGVRGYCLEVVRIVQEDAEGPEQWQCKRWGMDENLQPVKDGHHDMHYLTGLKPVRAGVWKDEWPHDTPRWMCCPLYYRQIDLDDPLYMLCRPNVQLGLF